MICAFAGILFTAKNASVSYDAGTGLELTVVAIVLFGGVSIFGGRGTLIGVVLSVVIVGFLQQAITQVPARPTIQNMKPQLQAIVIGILLLLSVILPNGGEAIRRLRDWTGAAPIAVPRTPPSPHREKGSTIDPTRRAATAEVAASRRSARPPPVSSSPTQRKAAP